MRKKKRSDHMHQKQCAKAYGSKPRPLVGLVGSVSKNVLARGFKVSEPNHAGGRFRTGHLAFK